MKYITDKKLNGLIGMSDYEEITKLIANKKLSDKQVELVAEDLIRLAEDRVMEDIDITGYMENREFSLYQLTNKYLIGEEE